MLLTAAVAHELGLFFAYPSRKQLSYDLTYLLVKALHLLQSEHIHAPYPSSQSLLQHHRSSQSTATFLCLLTQNHYCVHRLQYIEKRASLDIPLYFVRHDRTHPIYRS
ncbi:Uncharacterised protein [Chlamydia trachomatis]|nr:Uncharacterised protein [Chlamydia trachomatis]